VIGKITSNISANELNRPSPTEITFENMSITLDARVCKLGEKNQIEELRALIRKTSIKEVSGVTFFDQV